MKIESRSKKFQPDAMSEGEHFLYHSALSQYLNCGLLTPREVCQAVEKAYREKKSPNEADALSPKADGAE